MNYRIVGNKIYNNKDLAFSPGELTICDGEIKQSDPLSGATVIDLTGLMVIPGLIDTHIHGADGVDTMDAEHSSICKMAKFLAKHGVTTFFPTTVTSHYEKMSKALSVVGDLADWSPKTGGARVGGSYLEGPFINRDLNGAHPKELITEVDMDVIKSLNTASKGTLRTVAIAPEKEGALEAITELRRMGITVTIGHSSANDVVTDEAIRRGARSCIHLFNAMTSLHHRDFSLLGTSLITDHFAVELICDGIHVNPKCVCLAAKCKRPQDIVLITDAMCAAGMADGQYKLGELDISVKDGVARTETGALAGSTLKLLNGVVNFSKFTGRTFGECLPLATENPAKQMGIWDRTGSLEIGKSADIVALDDDYNVKFVMVNGNVLEL